MSYIPEHLDVTAETTGPQGGDAGHGGNTSITFEENGSGTHTVTVKLRNGATLDIESGEWESVTITAWGDWEGCGMHMGIRNAARALDPAWAETSGRFEADMAAEDQEK